MRGVWAEKHFMFWQKIFKTKFAFPESKKLFPPMPTTLQIKRFKTTQQLDYYFFVQIISFYIILD